MDIQDREEIERLIEEKAKRIIGQFDLLPDVVKSRHVGEGVRFIRAGVAASRPTSGEKVGSCYFETDTAKWKIWNGTVWKETTLT